MSKNQTKPNQTNEAKMISRINYTINVDYTDDLVFLANTPAQDKSLLHYPEQAARVISLYLKADKTVFICFKQEGAISSLSDKLLEFVDSSCTLEAISQLLMGCHRLLLTIFRSKGNLIYQIKQNGISFTSDWVGMTVCLYYLNANEMF